MNLELQKLSLRKDIQTKVHNDINKQQREYFLNQQMKTIQEELGGSTSEAEIEAMRVRGKAKKWNENKLNKALKKTYEIERSKI